MADYGIPRQSDLLIDNWFGKQADTGAGVMKPYEEPWYRALPNWLTDQVYGPDANAQQAAGVRHLVGPENPLNLPAQFSEGLDTARTGYQIGNNLMAGLGAFQAMTALPIPGAKVAGQVAKQEAKGIRAYHGSPHDFDKFDASKIGTGEGAQAFGHGLYFAENEGVAKSYRDGLSFNDTKPEHLAADAMRRAGGDRQKAAALVKSEMTEDMKIYEGAHYQRMLRARGMIERGEDIPQIPKGSMYEVRINADPEHFLDWDKPLSQQSEKVRSAILGTVPGDKRPYFEKWAADPDVTARDLYEQIGGVISPGDGKNHASPMVAAALRDAGVPGTKYLDQGSRAAGEGSRNYVVFDPATIEILRKYGLLGLMSGSVAAGAMPQQQPGILGQ